MDSSSSIDSSFPDPGTRARLPIPRFRIDFGAPLSGASCRRKQCPPPRFHLRYGQRSRWDCATAMASAIVLAASSNRPASARPAARVFERHHVAARRSARPRGAARSVARAPSRICGSVDVASSQPARFSRNSRQVGRLSARTRIFAARASSPRTAWASPRPPVRLRSPGSSASARSSSVDAGVQAALRAEHRTRD